MEGDNVIIDRARLEQLEKDSQALRTQADVIFVNHTYTPWMSPSVLYEYEGKDERIKNIVGIANERDNEVKELRNKYTKLYELIVTASFIKRLEYLFTKELRDEKSM